ncbi:hypothetical protein BGZ83_003751 [Gryganskiella cystojenkinii]|nr:hypothetical protein BGZ83_003751 [Gryganskiella cystojenkinii]
MSTHHQDKSQHPLLTPDILFHLSNHMNFKTLTQSIRVCRLWYDLLVPGIWRRIEYGRNLFPDQTLQKHAVHVHKIKFYCEFAMSTLAQTGIFFPRLKTLRLNNADNYKERHGAITLLERHSNASLEWLWVDSVASDQLLDAIAGVSTLEYLIIPYISMAPMRWIAWYENLQSRLRVLRLHVCCMDNSNDESAGRKMLLERFQTLHQTQLEEIEFGGDQGGRFLALIQLLIIQKSPRLKKLKWSFLNIHSEDHEHQAQMALLNRAVLTARQQNQKPLEALQKLESLTIPHAVFTRDEFAVVLGALSALKELDLTTTNFDQAAWRALRDHAPRYLNTLKVLDIRYCMDLSGSAVQEILCSATGLEIFRTDYITDSNLVADPRPWVCTGLKILEMNFVVKDLTNGPTILSRLGTLTQLEVLNLDGAMSEFRYSPYNLGTSEWKSNQLLHFTLEYGLDQMRGLTNLKIFRTPGTTIQSYPWRAAEARWVLQHWLRMKTLSVRVDPEARRLLQPTTIKGYCGLPRRLIF